MTLKQAAEGVEYVIRTVKTDDAVICVVSARGFGEEDAAAYTTISLVLLSVLLTSFNVYQKITKIGGAGSLVPITGFANAVASPAIEYKTEGFVMGVGANLFKIAGPVIAYGTVASVVYGVVYYIITLF